MAATVSWVADRTAGAAAQLPLIWKPRTAARLSITEVQDHLMTAQGLRDTFGGAKSQFRHESRI